MNFIPAPYFALALTAAKLVTPLAKPSVQPERFLACIAAVEGNKATAPGGIFGLSAATWRQHSKLPYWYASLRVHALYVAEKHLQWLEDSLRADGFEPTAYRLAVCWRAGLEGGKLRFTDPQEGYGRRVENLYTSTHNMHL